MAYIIFLLPICFIGGALEVTSFQFASSHSRLSAQKSRQYLARQSPLAATNSNVQPFLKYPLTQVVSDIDDTLKSSGGVTIAGVALGGIDVQYARGEFYPGVFQFMWELSLYSVKLNLRYYDDHFEEKGDGLKLTPPKVAVLTAVSLMPKSCINNSHSYLMLSDF
jgi:hypothetical protein